MQRRRVPAMSMVGSLATRASSLSSLEYGHSFPVAATSPIGSSDLFRMRRPGRVSQAFQAIFRTLMTNGVMARRVGIPDHNAKIDRCHRLDQPDGATAQCRQATSAQRDSGFAVAALCSEVRFLGSAASAMAHCRKAAFRPCRHFPTQET